MSRARYAVTGLVALALGGGAVALTGMFLAGKVRAATVPAFAEFDTCGQGIRVGGDVKLRGVLVGRIGGIEVTDEAVCRIRLDLFPSALDEIPANTGAQIRAKTVFGEKWVELLYPERPFEARIARFDTIHRGRTIDPLEVETILNVALPLLDAIDPERLAGALDALASGFAGHEQAAIEAIEEGIAALEPMNANRALLERGITQLDQVSEALEEVDDDLLQALENLIELNRYTEGNEALLAESLRKTPRLLGELSTLFRVRFIDLSQIVNQGATVIGVVAARSGDVERLLQVLPKFNSGWIRNLTPTCRYRMLATEPGMSKGDEVPGRCWRVHNILSESQGAYPPGEEPRPRYVTPGDYSDDGIELTSSIARLLYAPNLAQAVSR